MGHRFSSGPRHTRQVPRTWRNARLYALVLLGADQRHSHFNAQLLPVGGNVGMPAEENEGTRVITEPRPSLSPGEPHQTGGSKGMRDDILKVVKPRGHSGRMNSGDIGSPNRNICSIYVRSLGRYTVALEPVAQQVKTPAADSLGRIPGTHIVGRKKPLRQAVLGS